MSSDGGALFSFFILHSPFIILHWFSSV